MTFLPPTFMTVNHSLSCLSTNITGITDIIFCSFPEKGIFGMNAKEINPGTNGTLPLFVALAAPLTVVTIWVIIAFQSQYLLQNQTFMERLAWPVLLLHRWWSKKKDHTEDKARRPIDWTIRQDNGEMELNDFRV